MPIVHWIETEFARHFEDLDLGRGTDLDRNGAIEGSERTDLNGDGQVDSAEWQKFMGDNKAALEKLGGPFKTYYSAGITFKPDNLMHDLLSIESEIASPKDVKKAYDKVKKILRIVEKHISNSELKPQEKLRLVYDAIKQVGIELREQDNSTFVSNINENEGFLDCDTSSFVVLAIAHELNWPVHLVHAPGHAFVRWDDCKGKRFNMDYGRIGPDEFYIKKFDISPREIEQSVYLKNMDYDDILPHFYANRGIANRDLDRYEDAIGDFDKAIELDPNYAAAYGDRGYLKDELKRYEEAIKDYDRAIELNPKDVAAYYNRGNAKYKLKRYEEAIKDYDEAIELKPKNAAAYYNRGIVKDELRRYEEAIKDYNKAIELDPNDAAAYYNRGIVKDELKRYEEAIKDYDKAIELDPNDTDFYHNRKIARHELENSCACLCEAPGQAGHGSASDRSLLSLIMMLFID